MPISIQGGPVFETEILSNLLWTDQLEFVWL